MRQLLLLSVDAPFTVCNELFNSLPVDSGRASYPRNHVICVAFLPHDF